LPYEERKSKIYKFPNIGSNSLFFIGKTKPNEMKLRTFETKQRSV